MRSGHPTPPFTTGWIGAAAWWCCLARSGTHNWLPGWCLKRVGVAVDVHLLRLSGDNATVFLAKEQISIAVTLGRNVDCYQRSER